MAAALVFLAGSTLLAWFSRKPLRRPGSHGFYRFFAWECILALAVVNHTPWGSARLSPLQLVSWTLLAASVGLVAVGAATLLRRGGADTARDDAALYAWEKTGTLVTGGIFAYIRHPMYASLLALTWGFFFQLPNWPAAGIAVAGSVLLYVTARRDEQECRAHFGAAYDAYRQRTRMFVPFLF
ncbi:methyltransferase family protein [Azospira restricta]|uniref:Isoprenylcysteine carboxylmethyltransferase family protein n=1 Tax=Azospira restricta TaxID=404405 RepID=A0A974SS03_9RHOO|nr:isoprenylcysteine carboxylmethyltransferase family protein [Azospira restricta]QRJ65339.1 isoprenylcysteine carboxylmethyltransferase family protein [Azospira restricta]